MRSWSAASLRLLLLLLTLLATLPPPALALTASQVYEQVKDSVVVVKAYNKQGKQVGMGSAVMLPSGDVITNYHVVKAGVRYTVGRGKQGVPGTLKAGDPDKDLCLLAAPGLAADPARLGRAARLKVGEPVYAVGAPQGLELSLSEGIVSQLRGGPPPIIQTTVAISKGSSGGGLFNADGELVGITTFYLKDSQSLNFALPVEWIGQVARKIMPTKLIPLEDFMATSSGQPRERQTGEAPTAPSPGAKPKEDWKNRSEALEKAQDWHGLLAHCRRWTQVEPSNADAWYTQGYAYGKLGRHQEAIAAYREGLRLKPNYFDIWWLLGCEYGKFGRHQEAIAAYRKAIRLKPDFSPAWVQLGYAYGELGRHREEIETYREALRRWPNHVHAWYKLGLAFVNLERYSEAIGAFQEAVRIKPNFAEAWDYLALTYVVLGNRSAALEAVKELRRYDPQKADELFNLIMKR